jgi:formylglycine-generating enzyme required for sulfatase activity
MHGQFGNGVLTIGTINYEGAPTDGSAWLDKTDNDNRLLRGGSWNSHPEDCRSACRGSYDAGSRNYDDGFRVVCAAAWTQ